MDCLVCWMQFNEAEKVSDKVQLQIYWDHLWLGRKLRTVWGWVQTPCGQEVTGINLLMSLTYLHRQTDRQTDRYTDTHAHALSQTLSRRFTPVVTVLSTVWLSLLQLLTSVWFASPWLPHSPECLCVYSCVWERERERERERVGGIREVLQVYLVYLCSCLHH